MKMRTEKGMKKTPKNVSEVRGIQMVIYRKRWLMEDSGFVRTTNEPADIFHFNEGFL